MYDGRSALDKWLRRFEDCAGANGWDADRKGKCLPMFLEGEAHVVYMQLPEDKRTFLEVKAALEAAFSPPEGQGEHLRAFNTMTLREGESPRTFLFELQRSLDLAMPELNREARECLLFHQFVNGLPEEISVDIKTSRECLTTNAALARALLLTAVRKRRPATVAAAVESAAVVNTNDSTALALRVDLLERELRRLQTSEASGEPDAGDAIAAVTPARLKKRFNSGRYAGTHTFGSGQRDLPRGPRCFACAGYGHYARQCANNADAQSEDAKPGRAQQQGNARGAGAVRGASGRF